MTIYMTICDIYDHTDGRTYGLEAKREKERFTVVCLLCRQTPLKS